MGYACAKVIVLLASFGVLHAQAWRGDWALASAAQCNITGCSSCTSEFTCAQCSSSFLLANTSCRLVTFRFVFPSSAVNASVLWQLHELAPEATVVLHTRTSTIVSASASACINSGTYLVAANTTVKALQESSAVRLLITSGTTTTTVLVNESFGLSSNLSSTFSLYDTCTACDSSCASCTGTVKNCTACALSTYVLRSGECLSSTNCSVAHCALCPVDDYDSCTECNSNYSLSSQGQCIKNCSALCTNCTSSGCVECQPGTYLDSNDTSCSTCSTNCATCSGAADTCTSCEYGSVLINASAYCWDGSSCFNTTAECLNCTASPYTCSACKDTYTLSNAKCVYVVSAASSSGSSNSTRTLIIAFVAASGAAFLFVLLWVLNTVRKPTPTNSHRRHRVSFNPYVIDAPSPPIVVQEMIESPLTPFTPHFRSPVPLVQLAPVHSEEVQRLIDDLTRLMRVFEDDTRHLEQVIAVVSSLPKQRVGEAIREAIRLEASLEAWQYARMSHLAGLQGVSDVAQMASVELEQRAALCADRVAASRAILVEWLLGKSPPASVSPGNLRGAPSPFTSGARHSIDPSQFSGRSTTSSGAFFSPTAVSTDRARRRWSHGYFVNGSTSPHSDNGSSRRLPSQSLEQGYTDLLARHTIVHSHSHSSASTARRHSPARFSMFMLQHPPRITISTRFTPTSVDGDAGILTPVSPISAWSSTLRGAASASGSSGGNDRNSFTSSGSWRYSPLPVPSTAVLKRRELGELYVGSDDVEPGTLSPVGSTVTSWRPSGGAGSSSASSRRNSPPVL